MTPEQYAIMGTCLGAVLNDDVWQDLGFAGRPKYGRIVQRLRPKWRVNLEAKISNEILSTFTAAYVCSRKIDRNDLPSVVSAYFADIKVVAALGYSTSDEAINRTYKSISEYCDTPPLEWSAVLLGKLGLAELPDQEFAKILYAGLSRYSLTMKEMVSFLAKGK